MKGFLQCAAEVVADLQDARDEGPALGLFGRQHESAEDRDRAHRSGHAFVGSILLVRASCQPELGVGFGATIARATRQFECCHAQRACTVEVTLLQVRREAVLKAGACHVELHPVAGGPRIGSKRSTQADAPGGDQSPKASSARFMPPLVIDSIACSSTAGFGW